MPINKMMYGLDPNNPADAVTDPDQEDQGAKAQR